MGIAHVRTLDGRILMGASAELSLMESSFTSNGANGFGGGAIAVENGGTLIVVLACTFLSNHAPR